jgi:hypothetical protein
MNRINPEIRNLALDLIACEAAYAPTNGRVGDAMRVCEKVRSPLVKLAGVVGVRSLMARTMALAKSEVFWLDSVQICADGSLEGFDVAISPPDTLPPDEAGLEVLVQLLGLLVTFIGEPLTLRLVRDVWPDVRSDGMEDKAGGRS